MDPNNPVSSNSGQFDVNTSFVKQQQQQQQLIDTDVHHDLDFNRVICGMTRNGKHQDGDGNDDDYDYSDLGPETDVDAGEDALDATADVNRSLEPLVTSSSSSPPPREFFLEKSPMDTEVDNKEVDDNMEKDLLNRDNANVYPVDSVINDVSDNSVRLSDRDVCYDEKPRGNNDGDNDDGEARVESTTGMHTFVDDDESPPSPRTAKSIQHALIPEAENVADSEDSEDEWNYYRIDPSKKESTTSVVATNESGENIEEQRIQDPESGPRGDSEIQSSKIEADIKCEESVEKVPLEPVNIDTSFQKELSELEKNHIYCLDGEEKADDDKEDMDFQLNPEAAEFVPSSPPLLNNKNVLQDYLISGSPLKQTPAMDDILIPTQSEFEKEVCQRPKDIDEDFSNDEQHATGDNDLPDMDMSEISSTKAEIDDESMARIASTTQWQADNSQWSTTTRNDDAESDLEDNGIANVDNTMTVSLTPGDFEMAFEKGVDLNAVHELNDSSDDADNVNTSPRSPDELCVNESIIRADTPLLNDKESIDLLCVSSTPQSTVDQSTHIVTSESDEMENMFSVFKAESLPTDQLGVTPLTDDSPTQIELITSDLSNTDQFKYNFNESSLTISDEFNSANFAEEDISKEVLLTTNENLIDNQQVIDSSTTNYNETFGLSNELNYYKCLVPEKSVQDICEEKLAEESNKIQIEEEQTPLCELDDKTQSNLITETITDYDKLIECNSEMSGTSMETLLEPAKERLQDTDIINDNTTEPYIPIPCSKNELKLESNTLECQWTEERKLMNIPNVTDYDKIFQVNEDSRNSSILECNSTNICDENNKNDKSEKDEKPDSTVLSPSCISLNDSEEKLLKTTMQMVTHDPANIDNSTNIDKISETQIASEVIPTNKVDDIKPPETALRENVTKIDELEKQIVGAPIATTKTLAVTTTVGATKTKSTTTTTKRPTKTTPTTTKVTTSKTAMKITPTSPSKMASTTSARVSATSSSAQSTLAKKSIAARPKQLVDGLAKASTGGKVTSTKTTTLSKITTTMTTAKTSSLPRVGTTKSRTNTAVTASSKSSTVTSAPEKKSLSLGETKNVGKIAATRPASAKTTTTKATLPVKSSSSTTSSATLKPRPTSASMTVKTSLTASKLPATGASSRPKSAPSTSSGAIKPRENSTRTTAVKSTLIDKQSKDSVNKEISRSSASGTLSLSSRTGSKPSTPLNSNAAAKLRLSLGKTPGKSPGNGISPIKKSTSATKTASRTASSTPGVKNSSLIESRKVLQNGISEKLLVDVTRTAVITTTSDKLEDDVPRKDASPVNVPTDNQLIITD